MTWNWQQVDWPEWQWNPDDLVGSEAKYLVGAGRLSGVLLHLGADSQEAAKINLLTDEAVRSSAIEGDILDRASVQSSVRRAFGLSADRRSGAAETGIAELVTDGFAHWRDPLKDGVLFNWHRMVCQGRTDLHDLGTWRTQGDPMQVVSGPYQNPRVHFGTPQAVAMPDEMARLTDWFNECDLPALTRAGLAHLWLVSVHPFEDGNGRIARALSIKALAQGAAGPSYVSLSRQIEKTRKGYYDALEANNKTMEVTPWLTWFADTVLAAQDWSQQMMMHLINKTRRMDELRGRLNERQERAMLRLFEAGPDGFTGGMSAHNYMTITDTSPATARRDLGDLVEMGALTRTGERKGTRYWLVLAD